jgi:hypothetical protein
MRRASALPPANDAAGNWFGTIRIFVNGFFEEVLEGATLVFLIEHF